MRRVAHKHHAPKHTGARTTRVGPKSFRFFILPALIISSAAVLWGCSQEEKQDAALPPVPFVTAQSLFSVDALSTDHVWITGFNATVLHTADGGRTWQQVRITDLPTNVYDVSFADERNGWIAAGEGRIFQTTDGGATWSVLATGTDKYLLSIFFVDRHNGWAAGEFGTVIHTSDGGLTWASQGWGEDRIYNDVYFTDRLHGWIVGEYGLIYHTADGGETWDKQECKEIIPVVSADEWLEPTPSLYGVWFVDAARGFAAGMDGIIITTEDGGKSWQKIKSGVEGEKVTLFALQTRGDRAWAVGQKGTYLYSEDRGTTWDMRRNSTNTRFWIRALDFSDERNGWAVGSRGTILKTGNGGTSWDMISGIPVSP